MRSAQYLLSRAGFSFYAVTSEPGGNNAIKERLNEHIKTPLPFEVISDGALSLCVPKSLFYVSPNSARGYSVVQPALLILDTRLRPIKSWSWHNLVGIDDSMELTLRQGGLQKVRMPGCVETSSGSCHAPLVMIRPTARSMLAATAGGELSFFNVSKAPEAGSAP